MTTVISAVRGLPLWICRDRVLTTTSIKSRPKFGHFSSAIAKSSYLVAVEMQQTQTSTECSSGSTSSKAELQNGDLALRSLRMALSVTASEDELYLLSRP
jgi:hypothetical protein